MNPSRPRSARFRVALTVALLGLLLAACGMGEQQAAESDPAAPTQRSDDHAGHGDAVVEMQLIKFRPETITVAAGTEVTWKQADAGFHTVTSGTVEQGPAGVTASPDGNFDSGRLGTDDDFTFTFDQAGTFAYYCEIHPATMTGEVRVEE